MRLHIGMVKGGVAKSTSAWFLATALAREGRTLAIDADPSSQSLFDWANVAIDDGYTLPFEVQPWATDDLARKIRSVEDKYDHIIVDTGGENPRLFRAACAVIPDLLIPLAPNKAELRKLPGTFQAAQEVDAMGHPVFPQILLVRVNPSANDAAEAREFLAANDLPCMESQVRYSVHYSRAPGVIMSDLGDYEDVVKELKTSTEQVSDS